MYENFKIGGGRLKRATVADVVDAESRLAVKFPEGYREYVTNFGEGVLGGSYIRIYVPSRIVNELADWRKRIGEYWFWDLGGEVLSKEAALECVVVGDTVDGDELIVHPKHSQRIYVLPRYKDEIFVAGDGLPEAIEWLCGSGVLTEAFLERTFEPVEDDSA